ncbi:hypothetical protein Theco_0787 [Thermobacillus composti KWC4]|uniref:Uncharacterized protein n=1 Tax=Thermobacillus composti (strain DSM 18247 / JCM 13945 / KWC4) TaxID=717605 RepID=L0EB03_THECK|nr:hypothetical protein Theco_0787 [Thermobacillus composti KWC4]REJ17966.1 MAG: hypothetical protein C6W59_06275 [Paenibacillaceae bacterium]
MERLSCRLLFVLHTGHLFLQLIQFHFGAEETGSHIFMFLLVLAQFQHNIVKAAIHARFHSIDPLFKLPESYVDLFESSVDLFESSVDLFESSVDLFKSSVDLLKSIIHLTFQLLEPLLIRLFLIFKLTLQQANRINEIT